MTCALLSAVYYSRLSEKSAACVLTNMTQAIRHKFKRYFPFALPSGLGLPCQIPPHDGYAMHGGFAHITLVTLTWWSHCWSTDSSGVSCMRGTKRTSIGRGERERGAPLRRVPPWRIDAIAVSFRWGPIRSLPELFSDDHRDDQRHFFAKTRGNAYPSSCPPLALHPVSMPFIHFLEVEALSPSMNTPLILRGP